MGRHRTPEEKAALKVRATEMRLAGIGRARIGRELGIGAELVGELLRDVPPPSWLGRVRAKDEHRAAAEALRRQGRTYKEIQQELGVSKSSLSLWLRDLPGPTAEQRAALANPSAAEPEERDEPVGDRGIARALRGDGWLLREIAEELGASVAAVARWCEGLPVPPRASHGHRPDELARLVEAYWSVERQRRAAMRRAEIETVRARVPHIDDTVLDLIVATAYWCEGGKRKPWRATERLDFINSDPHLVGLFLEWLRRRACGLDRWRLALSIHESADVPAATRFWADVVGCDVSAFRPPTLKRHNPKTVRHNTGEQYVGCLAISVRQSRPLYREIEGLWTGIVSCVLGEGSVEQNG